MHKSSEPARASIARSPSQSLGALRSLCISLSSYAAPLTLIFVPFPQDFAGRCYS